MAKSNLAYNESHFVYSDYGATVREERRSNLRIKPVRKTDIKETVSAANKPRTKAKAKKKSNLALVVLAAVAFLVLCRGVMITEQIDRVEKKRAELNALTTANEKTQIEIDSATNLKNVEEIATTRLNMARPEKNQTVYIKIEQPDVVEKIDGSGNVDSVSDFFGTLQAYLD